jgi:hypothetical protein
MNMFEKWCALRGECAIPASPTIIARFIKDIEPLGIARIWPEILQISRAHYTVGLPDVTNSFPVASAINALSRLAPPRSWPAEEKLRFATLPYDIQVIILKRETDRDREVKHMHTNFAKLKKETEHAASPTAPDAAA